MALVKFNIDTEVRKFLAGKKTKVRPEVLLHLIAEDYLEMGKRR